jgi:aspartyl-tRNA(Asn)/glutamyl-tRNA(Gln) amidotransferase subunit A
MLEICLARIDRYEPKVKAWVYIDRERARREADQLTTELKDGLDRGPLHGIPIGVKDIIDVYDMPTGCGSKLWANSYARRDATCVERLRQAGALILGKTVTTAYAYLDPPVTRNPWNLERTPGGSSSGSAAAVACGMCLGALGTQTGGSIIRPAAFCGVCALKPTYGRVSVDGVLPLAPSLDHVGVMANCVRDLAVLFETIAGPDSRGDFLENHHPITDCKIEDLEIPNLYPLNGFFDEKLDSAIRPEYRKALETLIEANSVVTPAVPPAGFAVIHSMHLKIMATEAARVHGERLQRHPDDYPVRIRELIEIGLRTPAVETNLAFSVRASLEEQVTRMLGHRVFVTPATPRPAPGPDTTGDPSFNSPWSFLGMPALTIPLGWSKDALPLSIQITTNPSCEDELFAAARKYESSLSFDRRKVML